MAGPQCCEIPLSLSSSYGVGSVIELGGFKSYVTGPAESTRAVLFVSDAFGYETPKLRKLADKVAMAGFYVVVPDFFYGEPYEPRKVNVCEWLKSHGVDKGFEDAKQVLVALRSQNLASIGAAGFCWGGKVVMELTKSPDIQAAVLLHPSLVTVDDIKEVKAPISILGAEFDERSPPELLKQFGEVLSTRKEVDGHVKIFPGVEHGWTVRYKDEDEKIVRCAEEAHQNMLEWFAEYVK